jgi:uncharacterized membrane protein YfcA
LDGAVIVVVAITTIVLCVTRTQQLPVEDTDAAQIPPFRRFLTTMPNDEMSEVPPNLFPLSSGEYIGFGLAILSLLLAAGAGAGGGGILVPIYILVMGFPVKFAIPLACVTVLGGAVSNNLHNWSKMNPNHPERPLIDWDLLLMLEPSTIAGALGGVVLNSLLPDIVILVCMVMLLVFTAFATLDKANSLYKKESDAIMKAITSTGNVNEVLPLLAKNTFNNGATLKSDKLEENIMTEKELEKSLFASQVRSDFMKLTLLFLVVTVINLIAGGLEKGDSPTGLPGGNTTFYWASQGVILLILFGFFFFVRRALLLRVESGGPVLSDIEWNARNSLTYPGLAVTAGLVAGLFGIGGGIINGPLMLALGMYTQSSCISPLSISFMPALMIRVVLFGFSL